MSYDPWFHTADLFHRAGMRFLAGFPADSPSLTDAAARHPGLETLVPRDQRMLGCIAAGYTHTSGLPALLEVSTGPAVLNAVTGLAELASLRLPAVLVTTGTAPASRGKGTFQETDQTALLGPLAVWYHTLADVNDLPWAARSALWQATGPRPGIAVLEIPADLFGQAAAPAPEASHSAPHGRRPRLFVPPPGDLAEATALLEGSSRPVVVVGGGARAARAGSALVRLATGPRGTDRRCGSWAGSPNGSSCTGRR